MSETEQSKPQSQSEAKPTPAKKAAKGSATARAEHRGKVRGWHIALILLILLAVVLGAGLYYQNQQYQRLLGELDQQHRTQAQRIEAVQSQAAQALEKAQEQADQIAALRSTLNDVSEHVRGLDQALQMVSDSGSDLLLLNDIDHLVTIAQQQLSLGGNVANAIASLEAAQAQLARANRPNLAALQQSINGDLDRLRAVATIDLPGLSAQVDRLSKLVGSAPLLVPDAARPETNAPAAQRGAFPTESLPARPKLSEDWRGWAKDAWHWTRDGADALTEDLKGLFDVRRVDDAAALLISPDQAQRFREGLKQRAITAQLALLMHQAQIWRNELQQISQAIDERYDMRAESSREALSLARLLHDTPITISLPSVDNSLDAIAAARDAAEAGEEPDAPPAGDADAEPESGASDETPAGASQPAASR